MKQVALSILFSLSCLQISAQLYYYHTKQPALCRIRVKYYNGTGGRHYWDVKTTDSAGRIVNTKSYYKRHLQSIDENQYNSYGDIICTTYTTCNRKGDTNKQKEEYVYKYQANRITYQENWYENTHKKKSMYSCYKLISGRQVSDSSYEDSYEKQKWDVCGYSSDPERIVFIYNRGMLMKMTEIQHDSTMKITNFEYYENGNEKRRKTERIPEPALKPRCVGGPGSDDMYYTYQYDTKGRMVKIYVLTEGKTYKLASYKYKKL